VIPMMDHHQPLQLTHIQAQLLTLMLDLPVDQLWQVIPMMDHHQPLLQIHIQAQLFQLSQLLLIHTLDLQVNQLQQVSLTMDHLLQQAHTLLQILKMSH
jgi:hypothetical protein